MAVSGQTLQFLLAQAEGDGIQKLGVGAIICREGRYLILRRAATEDFLPGLEEIPSGGVEPGEGLLEALSREVEEETGLRVTSILAYVDFFDYLSGSGRKTREFNFLVDTDGGEVRLNPAEHDAYAWLAPEEEAFRQASLSPETRASVLKAALAF